MDRIISQRRENTLCCVMTCTNVEISTVVHINLQYILLWDTIKMGFTWTIDVSLIFEILTREFLIFEILTWEKSWIKISKIKNTSTVRMNIILIVSHTKMCCVLLCTTVEIPSLVRFNSQHNVFSLCSRAIQSTLYMGQKNIFF